MTSTLLTGGILLVLLTLFLAGWLFLSLRRAIDSSQERPEVATTILTDPPRIEISIRHPHGRGIRLDGLVLDRGVAETLGAGPPNGFRLGSGDLPERETFEADLEDLADLESPPTLREIEAEENAQFEEAKRTAIDFGNRYTWYEGRVKLPPSGCMTVTIPLVRVLPVGGDLLVTYSARSGPWRISDGVTASVCFPEREDRRI